MREDPLNLVTKGSETDPDTKIGNPSNSPNPDHITENVKKWILKPVLILHFSGLIALTAISILIIGGYVETTEWIWPAIIAGFTGIPFGFAANVKKITEAFSPN